MVAINHFFNDQLKAKVADWMFVQHKYLDNYL